MGDIVNEIFGLVFALNLVWLIWCVAMYFAELTSEEAKREYKPLIIGGASMLVFLMLLWVLVEWIRASLGL